MTTIEALADALAPSGLAAMLEVDQTVLDLLPCALYVCTADGTLVRYNKCAAELWGRAPRPGETDCAAFHLDHRNGELRPTEAALRSGEPQRAQEVMIERPDGSRINARVDVAPLTDEFGAVGGAIACAHEIPARNRTEELASDVEARAQLAAIVEFSEDAILSKDLDGTITSWNAGAQRLFGYTADETVGRSVTMLMSPERRHEERGILEKIRRGERIEHFETERVRKDGSRVHISLTISPIRDAEGRITGASKIARDITEHKKAEEHRTLLINELNHRVRNTLATVQAIAAQTLHGSDPSLRQKLEARLMALSGAHSILTQENWEGAEIHQIIASALKPHAAAGRFEIGGPAIRLFPNTAVALAMSMHELATNAAKYGALSGSEGKIAVTWSVSADADQVLTVQWKESGGPPVTPPAKRGFGSRLIERSLAHDLDGQASIEFRPEGVVCTITSRLSSIGTRLSHA
jgi:two-component system, chemotaxis family, CheB/CheR fusion protein